MTDASVKVPLVTVAGKEVDCESIVRDGVTYYRQRVRTNPDETATGILTNLNDAVTIILDGRANATFQIEHVGWTGTVSFEGSNGAEWVPVYGMWAGTGQSKTAYTDTPTGTVFRCVTAGLGKIRIRLSAVGAGSVTINAVATSAAGGVFVGFPLPQGENIIGSVGTPEYAVASNPAALNGKAAELVTVHGYRRQWSGTTVYGDVCPYLVGGQARMNTPDPGVVQYLVSTSAQDLTAGSGVDRVRITYLDSAGVEQTVDASINGTTPVSLGSGISFVQMMESWHSATSDRYPVGNITISSVNGVATESTTVEMIRATHNRSQSGRYKIATGRHGHLIDYHVNVVKLGAGSEVHDVAVEATTFNNKTNGLSNAFRMLRGCSLADGVPYTDDAHYKYLPPGTVIKMVDKPTAAGDGNVAKMTFDLLVVDI